MREIRTYGLTRGRALRDIRGVPLYSTQLIKTTLAIQAQLGARFQERRVVARREKKVVLVVFRRKYRQEMVDAT